MAGAINENEISWIRANLSHLQICASPNLRVLFVILHGEPRRFDGLLFLSDRGGVFSRLQGLESLVSRWTSCGKDDFLRIFGVTFRIIGIRALG